MSSPLVDEEEAEKRSPAKAVEAESNPDIVMENRAGFVVPEAVFDTDEEIVEAVVFKPALADDDDEEDDDDDDVVSLTRVDDVVSSPVISTSNPTGRLLKRAISGCFVSSFTSSM